MVALPISSGFIVVNSSRYAGIDLVSPTQGQGNCQSEAFALPPGWSLVPPSQEALVVVLSRQWGAGCSVFSGALAAR